MFELEFTVENLKLIKDKIYYPDYEERQVLDVMVSIADNNEKMDCLSESNICSRDFLLNVINKAFECNVRASLGTLLKLVYTEYETPSLLAVKMARIVKAIKEIKESYPPSEYPSLYQTIELAKPVFRTLDENETEDSIVETGSDEFNRVMKAELEQVNMESRM